MQFQAPLRNLLLHLRHQRCRWQRKTSYQESLVLGNRGENELVRVKYGWCKIKWVDQLTCLRAISFLWLRVVACTIIWLAGATDGMSSIENVKGDDDVCIKFISNKLCDRYFTLRGSNACLLRSDGWLRALIDWIGSLLRCIGRVYFWVWGAG